MLPRSKRKGERGGRRRRGRQIKTVHLVPDGTLWRRARDPCPRTACVALRGSPEHNLDLISR
eukprot:6815386-Heterocapsa_arctica.AAC.1